MTRNTTDEVRYQSLFEHGSDMERFRKSMMEYQKQVGLDLSMLPEIGGLTFGGIQL